MGFKWKDAVSGGLNGFQLGMKSGNPLVALGLATAGATTGGYAKDLDKRLTGNSQSGTVEGALDVGGTIGGGGVASNGGNLFDAKFNKTEEGYENNPAVLAREKQPEGHGIGDIMNQFSGSGERDNKQDVIKVLNMFNSMKNDDEEDLNDKNYIPRFTYASAKAS